MITKLFNELGLSPEILKAIDKLGFEKAAPIQAAAIPVLMAGKDVVGQSQTGSGKTAAFAIPAIEKTDPNLRAVQVLVLCPTRELAIQVAEEVYKLALFKRGIHALPIYGGQSYERQFYGLKQGAQIVIGTPGRVMDHMRRGTMRLDSLKMLILDEADVMLDMGFREDIEFVLQSTPKERQTVFFSATMPRPIRDLIERFAREPQAIAIEQKEMTVPTVEQTYYEVDRRFKMELLTRLIDLHDLKLGIIFCNTKRMVDDLVDHLSAQGYSADRLHGDMSQMMRDRVMNKFRKGGLEFLVATDVAARGIDVDNIEIVFNYDLPYDGEDYVHRIGRTGRAGRSGRAVTFVSGREVFLIRNIERFTRTHITRGRVPTAEEVGEARANVFLDKLRSVLKDGDFKKQDRLVEQLLEEGFTTTDITSALLHLLQSGSESAKPPAREEAPARPERPPFREERRERFDDRPPRGPRYDDRRGPGPGYGDQRGQGYGNRFEDRRGPRPDDRYEQRAPGARPFDARREVSHPVRPAAPAALPKKSPVAPAAKAPAPAATPAEHSPAAAAPEMPPVSTPAPAPELTHVPATIEPARPMTESRPPTDAPAAPAPAHSRRAAGSHTRLWIGIGEEMQISPDEIVTAILGQTGLPRTVVGTVDVRERHTFVDVAAECANSILAKMKRAEIKGKRIKAKLA
ncbi:MAG: DEAD/DEAH box helicase [Verrucomicrobia bacterium]|nr:DEAD/DEAH box helicase [Verrucomicrobiota bacterium]